MKLRKGDIVFTSSRGNGLIDRQIAWWTRTWFEKPTCASHVAVITEPSGHLADSLIVEQTWPKIRRTVLGRYMNSAPIYIFRDTRLSDTERLSICRQAMSAKGFYGVSKILTFLTDAVIGKIFSLPVVIIARLFGRKWRGFEPKIFSRLNLTGTVVCSHFVARLWWRIGYHFSDNWIAVTPDDMMDHCQLNPNHFKLVYDRSS